MRNEAPLSEDSIIEEEAADWVALRMGDQHFDQDRFEKWVNGGSRRSVVFELMWERIMGGTLGDALESYDGQRRNARGTLLAASLAVLVAGLSSYFALPSAQLFLSSPQVYASDGEGLRLVRLEDGTRIDLAPDSKIRVRYTGHDRYVELERGTLFADVVRDSDRPLTVHAGNGEVTVLGTRFEVARHEAAVHVVVQSGGVAFGHDGWFATPISLAARNSATLRGDTVSLDEDVHDMQIARWRDEWVDYHQASLAEVVTDLQSLSSLPIRIASPRLRDREVSGRIRLVDPVRQLENLSIVHDFAVRTDDNAIVLAEK